MKLDSSQLVLEEDMLVPGRVYRFEKVSLLRLNEKTIRIGAGIDFLRVVHIQLMLWWFGLVVWILRIPENERDC